LRLGGVDPVAESLVVHAEFLTDVTEGTARRADQLDRVPPELLGVL
jgi:hypothetical protein